MASLLIGFTRGRRTARLCDRAARAFEDGAYQDAHRDWMAATAEDHSGEAAYRLGLLYANGAGVVRNVPDAVAWYDRAADRGGWRRSRTRMRASSSRTLKGFVT